MGAVTVNGYEIKPLDQIIAEVEASLRTIYGSDIDLSAKSSDGQLVGIISQMFADMEELNAAGYSMLDPNQCSGKWVEMFLAYKSLTRKSAMVTILPNVEIKGTAGRIISEGYSVTHKSSGAVFALTSPVTIGSNGTVSGSFNSTVKGAFTVLINDVLTPVNVIAGVTSVINKATSTGGLNEEKDAEAIDRAKESDGINSQNALDGLVSEIRAMADVVDCRGYENESSGVDSSTNLPANCIYIVVDGGTPSLIADAIMRRKSMGVKTVGKQSYTIENISGTPRTYNWDQTTLVPVKVRATLSRKRLLTDIATTTIANNIADIPFSIGQNVYAYEIADTMLDVSGFYIRSIELSRNNGATWSTISADILINEKATISASDVSLTVVV